MKLIDRLEKPALAVLLAAAALYTAASAVARAVTR